MADLVNRAVKDGRYYGASVADEESSEMVQNDLDWHPKFLDAYDQLRANEKQRKSLTKKYSGTFTPLVKFLKLVEKNRSLQPKEEPKKEVELPDLEDAAPALLMAHNLAEAIAYDQDKAHKLADALSFASTEEKEKALAAKHPQQYGQVVSKA